jgi:hypothetical protein
VQIHPRFRELILLLLLPVIGMTASCDQQEPRLTATFWPGAPDPGPMSIVLRPGVHIDERFDVKVAATGIPDLGGVVMAIRFDSEYVEFVQASSEGSPLRTATDETTYHEAIHLHPSDPDVLTITMYRIQNQAGTLPPASITWTDDLLNVRFRARKATSGTPFEIFPESRACDFAGAPPGEPSDCTPPLGVTWSGGTASANYQTLEP